MASERVTLSTIAGNRVFARPGAVQKTSNAYRVAFGLVLVFGLIWAEARLLHSMTGVAGLLLLFAAWVVIAAVLIESNRDSFKRHRPVGTPAQKQGERVFGGAR